jgi:hypothetical protein
MARVFKFLFSQVKKNRPSATSQPAASLNTANFGGATPSPATSERIQTDNSRLEGIHILDVA